MNGRPSWNNRVQVPLPCLGHSFRNCEQEVATLTFQGLSMGKWHQRYRNDLVPTSAH